MGGVSNDRARAQRALYLGKVEESPPPPPSDSKRSCQPCVAGAVRSLKRPGLVRLVAPGAAPPVGPHTHKYLRARNCYAPSRRQRNRMQVMPIAGKPSHGKNYPYRAQYDNVINRVQQINYQFTRDRRDYRDEISNTRV